MADSKYKKPTLANPDLSGLWSCAHLGHDKKWWSKIAGTIIVATFVYSWVGGCLLPFFILFLCYIKFYNVAIIISTIALLPYIIPISPQPWICRIYMKYGAGYFDGGCSQSFEKPPPARDHPILAALHPHGLLCMGFFLVSGIRFRAIQDLDPVKDKKQCMKYAGLHGIWEGLSKRTIYVGLIVNYLCNAPLFNLMITKLTRCVDSASNANMRSLMKRRVSFGILPGGFDEATVYKKGENIIYIKQRKGFIKYCLRYGYELFPMFVFGESETYHNLFHSDNKWITSLKHWLNKKHIPTVFPIGPYWFSPFLPFSDIGIHGILSANTRYEHIENPTQKQIDECHEWHMNEINALFERHKWRFGYSKETKLKIV